MPNNVRSARAKKLWSQEKLAAEAGVALKTVSFVERGVVRPNVLTQEKLARALGVERTDLFPEPAEVSA